MAGYWQDFIEDLGRTHGFAPPKIEGPAATAFEAARARGGYVQGKGYPLQAGDYEADFVTRTLEDMRATGSELTEDRMRRLYPDNRTRTQKVDEHYAKATEDPNLYVDSVVPADELARIWGTDAYREKLQAALLSASRPKPLLSRDPGAGTLSRHNIAQGISDPVYVIQGPGFGFKSTAPGMQGFNFAGRQRPPSEVLVPFEHRSGRVGQHELLGHGVLHRRPEASNFQHAFFNLYGDTTVPGQPARKYQNRYLERQANAGVLIRQHFQKTGEMIRNKAQAEALMDSLLKEQPVSKSTPNPNAEHGGMKGQPIEDYFYTREREAEDLRSTDDAGRDKWIEQAPMLMNKVAPKKSQVA